MPVVSVSLGNTCQFWLRHKNSDQPIRLHLESGDIILFGGPCRHILHTVKTVLPNSCPEKLCQLQKEMAFLAPDPLFMQGFSGPNGVKSGLPGACRFPRGDAGTGSGAFRINLTFRHAPELLGMERTERFHMFGDGQRMYLDTLNKVGASVARKEAQKRRAAVMEKRKLRATKRSIA